LHYAHRTGLVHRDIKPGNILIDNAGKPHVADFGLALRDEDFGKGAMFLGTPLYMSPEQARSEGHRVDGRSDIFSLGVVFYELLTGRQPFRGDSRNELLEQITMVEPRPPRQLDDTIPRELDRICLKALAKRASDRYSTAQDLGEDLRHWQATRDQPPMPGPPNGFGREPDKQRTQIQVAPNEVEPVQPPARIVPRGLRSFDARDAEFFLDLLPGARDRHGLPESVAFWKARIEERDPEQTFSVGLLSGPSGSGKSSLVKAGLLPRLAGQVVAVYVEATPDDTPARLLQGLRKRCRPAPAGIGLVDTVTHLRRHPPGDGTGKVVLVLDQFEQWLHGREYTDDRELVEALRQCDGRNLQALVLVRGDFGTAAWRFMRELEVRIVEGHNFATVDLFDARHARKVLAAFGRALGCLAEGGLTTEQDRFLDQAVVELTQAGQVVPVRLALFAELVKDKPWTPATLKASGGAEGLGVTFLEESLGDRPANPGHRPHCPAARAVLATLLPERGSDIRGNRRSRQELLAASGYERQPEDFEELVCILDAELRLLTPTDPDGMPGGDQQETPKSGDSLPAPSATPAAQYYQLTHDYLVPSLREWLTRKQRETRRGRARLRLAERATLWSARPQSRHLPAWWEWLLIRAFTRKRDWTPPQRRMMRRTIRYYAVRVGVLIALISLAVLTLIVVVDYSTAAQLAEEIRTAETADVPALFEAKDDGLTTLLCVRPHLVRIIEDARTEKEVLNARLVLVKTDPSHVEPLCQALLRAQPLDLLAIRGALLPHKEQAAESLWAVVEDEHAEPSRQFTAACALALLDPESPRWAKTVPQVVVSLVRRSLYQLPWFVEMYGPIREHLLAPLQAVYQNQSREEEERFFAAGLLAEFRDNSPEWLAELILQADNHLYARLVPNKAMAHQEPIRAAMDEELAKTLEPKWPNVPHDPAWPGVASDLVRQLEDTAGMLTDQFALCQTLSLEEFDTVAKDLGRSGYRLLTFRPYPLDEAVRVAAIWSRDGKDCRWVHGVSAAAIREQNEDLGKKGYAPSDVAGWARRLRTGEWVEEYSALWEKRDGDQETQLYVGITGEEAHRQERKLLTDKNFVPSTQTYFEFQGLLRHSAVWRKPRQKVALNGSHLGRDLAAYQENLTPSHLQTDVRLVPYLWRRNQECGEIVALLARAPAAGFAGLPWGGMALDCGQGSAHLGHPDYAAVWQTSTEYVSEQVQDLRLSPDDHRDRCRQVVATAKEYRPAALSVAATGDGRTAVAASVWHRPVVPNPSRRQHAWRQARAALTLLHLGQEGRVWPLLKHSSDPQARTYLIHHLSELGTGPDLLMQRLDVEQDVPVKRALCLALGGFSWEKLPRERERRVEWLRQRYQKDRDPGIHGAVDWLLRQWGCEWDVKKLDAVLKGQPPDGRLWYINSQEQTLAIFPGPVEFSMGSPGYESGRNVDERLHRRRIPRSFALATKPVTVEQFRVFRPGDAARGITRPWSHGNPVTVKNWYDAAAYCNWLSKQEGLSEKEWCYPEHIGPGMMLPSGYLSRTGYRLPTEAEWEYACRAGADTSYFYGDQDEWGERYIGAPKPNDFGLFNMGLGESELCQNLYLPYRSGPGGQAIEAREELFPITDHDRIVVRGTSALRARAAERLSWPRGFLNDDCTFRVARTHR
jgi:formylglycine-generating enzyme required for sulfatase activity